MSTVEPEGEQALQPAMSVIAQYVKDLSFENPRAPESLRPQETAPQISVSVNVSSRQRSATEFEVDLRLDVNAKVGSDVQRRTALRRPVHRRARAAAAPAPVRQH
jgi:preprotein translocase subunit SecB